MSKYGEMARPSGVVVAAYEIFFTEEKTARICAERSGGKVERLDDGWLVRKKIESTADDDPTVQAITRALKEAGLI